MAGEFLWVEGEGARWILERGGGGLRWVVMVFASR